MKKILLLSLLAVGVSLWQQADAAEISLRSPAYFNARLVKGALNLQQLSEGTNPTAFPKPSAEPVDLRDEYDRLSVIGEGFPCSFWHEVYIRLNAAFEKSDRFEIAKLRLLAENDPSPEGHNFYRQCQLLLPTPTAPGVTAIQRAANQMARIRKFDFLVDEESIWFGKAWLKKHGRNVTTELVRNFKRPPNVPIQCWHMQVQQEEK